MPYDVPVENAIGVAQAVYETDFCKRNVKELCWQKTKILK